MWRNILKTGIIILNYNDVSTTLGLVSKIGKYKSLNYIVVVDNCSTDDSYTKLCTLKSEKTHVIKSDKNGGYSYGNNCGIKYLISSFKVDIIFIANPDVEFDEIVVLELVNLFEKTDYAMLSGIMLDSNGIIKIGPLWKIPSYFDDVINCFLVLSYIKQKRSLILSDYLKDNIIDVDLLPGSFFAIRSSIIESIGYFDEGTFLYCEERILARKLKDEGYKTGLVTNVEYFHLHGSSIEKTYKSIQTRKMLFESKLYYQVKYNKIHWFKQLILKICMKVSVIEYKIYLTLKEFSNQK